MFKPEFFIRNRQVLLAAANVDLIVIGAHGQLQKTTDQGFSFRQDSNFWYLTGCNEPDITLVISRSGDFLIMADRPKHRDQWDGAVDQHTIVKQAGIKDIYTNKEGWQQFKTQLRGSRQVGILKPAPEFLRPYGLFTNPAKRKLWQRISRLAPNIYKVDVRPFLASQRSIKQDAEIRAIKEAIELTEQALAVVQTELPNLKHEYEVLALLDYEYRRHASDHAFDAVVAAGGNAATVHYHSVASPIASQDMLLVDTGASSGLYAADITRMFGPRQGLNNRQAEIVEAVKKVQTYAVGLIRPGVVYRDYEKKVQAYMGEALIGLGLIGRSEPKAVRQYFCHATSHHLGLDVHDIANYDQPFAKNMVLTVEPGIYIPEEGIGVRIEDDVIVTENGCRPLSKLF